MELIKKGEKVYDIQQSANVMTLTTFKKNKKYVQTFAKRKTGWIIQIEKEFDAVSKRLLAVHKYWRDRIYYSHNFNMESWKDAEGMTYRIDNTYGIQQWCNRDNKLHREDDKPAVIFKTASDVYDYNWYRAWWINGKTHRDDDKPAIIIDNRYMEWYHHGKRHRKNKGASVLYKDTNDIKEWWYFNHGTLHRMDGPAIIGKDKDTIKFYFHGRVYPLEKWLEKISPFRSKEFIMKMKLKWSTPNLDMIIQNQESFEEVWRKHENHCYT